MSPWSTDSDKCVPNLGPYNLCHRGRPILTYVYRIWTHTFYVALVDEFWQMCAKCGPVHSISPWLTGSDKCVPNMGPYNLCRPGWRILTNVCRIWAHTLYVALVEVEWQMCVESGPIYSMSCWWFLLTNLCRILTHTPYHCPGWSRVTKSVPNLSPIHSILPWLRSNNRMPNLGPHIM